MTKYAELIASSNFSFLQGASHPDELVKCAYELGVQALAMTDRNSFAGIVRAHKQAKELGFSFIPGTRLVLQDGIEIGCLPTNRQAYAQICQLLTTGNRRANKGDCYLWLDDVLKFGQDSIFIVLPDNNDKSHNLNAIKTLNDCYKGNIFLGAPLFFDGEDARRLSLWSDQAISLHIPMVAVGDCLYHSPQRKPLQDVLTCIREKCTIKDAGFKLNANAERHLKAPDEIARLYRGYEYALETSIEISDRCAFSLDELTYEYPDEPYEPYSSPQEALTAYTWQGAETHYPDGIPKKVKENLEHELKLISELDYARYFLTVYDLVRFARSNNILCQGRGSAANSSVCYCLGITSVDPAEIDLLFERFVSAERNEPPDIDVDFEHERREEVIQYIYAKYGRHRAGIAATVVTYRSRSAVREVGKALGLSQDVIGVLASTIWGWSSKGVEESNFLEIGLDPSDPNLKKTVWLTQQLVGFPRHLSQHTGGFVITRGSLDEIIPIANAAMPERTYVEWDKDDLETLGMLKIDVLALGMLTCIRKGFDLLEKHYDTPHTLATIPQGDTATYDMICKADTVGVFQIESRAQMSMLPRLRPRTFYDLVIEVAIVRPGPIQGDMVHPYLRRRQKLEPVKYPTKELRQVLEKTLGVPLFQEQAMKIAIVAAGFTPSEADALRRAMATFRKTGTIHGFHIKMVQGMKQRGYDEEFAERCFRQIEGFGEYGFPESHAASFALLVYVSCWLKCHYPDVFACALLNSQPMGFYAPAQIVRDLQDHNGQVRPVDINHSDWDYKLEPIKDKKNYALRLGLRQIKGLSQDDADLIMKYRKTGYTHIDEFSARTALSPQVLNKLAEADVFRSIGLDRRKALWAVSRYQETDTPSQLIKGLPLFEHTDSSPLGSEPEASLPDMKIGEHVIQDYATLRMSLKAHPMKLLRPSFQQKSYIPAHDLVNIPHRRFINIAGIVLVRQRPGSASGVIFSTLEDETGVANIVIWPACFEKYRRIVMSARLLGVYGQVQKEQGVIHIIAKRLRDESDKLSSLGHNSHDLDFLASADEVRKPGVDPYNTSQGQNKRAEKVLPKGRNFH